MENTELKKAKAVKLIDILGYTRDSIKIKTIIKRITGSICFFSFDSKIVFKGKIIPFDTFIECIEGKAVVEINEKSELLEKGQVLIIPAHAKNTITTKERFKMMSVIIKSGYEDVS